MTNMKYTTLNPWPDDLCLPPVNRDFDQIQSGEAFAFESSPLKKYDMPDEYFRAEVCPAIRELLEKCVPLASLHHVRWIPAFDDNDRQIPGLGIFRFVGIKK